ncbi:hypothetical protein GCM10009504_05930 [Pseudomonas laurentiana]|uniref:Lipoprotein n=1 Tax=Pseudomonas laurentiana TaxID=2364649 RepID=A0A6I5RPA9_9PSED|nr:hypothetical protein [Pseudomonas laurentiana]NES09757.1 hypothetical protein [Pseudomonas laurentiana]GGU51965.1 hypothetical protein GCM10009504_05930 [Pseudomonas laurentiana]
MNRIPSLALLVMTSVISGCATTGDHQVVNVPLNATQYNTGHIASALLASTTGNRTGLTIVVGGVPSSTALPAHIDTYIYSGTCENPGSKPVYEMKQSVTARSVSSPLRLSTVAPATLSELRSGGYVLVLRAGPMDGSVNLFCGNIT